MTGGGPGGSTETVSLYAFQSTFRYLDSAYGAAVALAGIPDRARPRRGRHAPRAGAHEERVTRGRLALAAGIALAVLWSLGARRLAGPHGPQAGRPDHAGPDRLPPPPADGEALRRSLHAKAVRDVSREQRRRLGRGDSPVGRGGALPRRALSRAGPRASRERALFALLSLAVVPPILLLLPLYAAVRALGWLNSPLALIVPYALLNLPLAAWILDAGFRQIPGAIDEAAALDGLTRIQRLARIQLPLVAPSAVTAAVLVFIFSWNEFMLALTFMTRDDAQDRDRRHRERDGLVHVRDPVGTARGGRRRRDGPARAPRPPVRAAHRERPDARRGEGVGRERRPRRRRNHEGLRGRRPGSRRRLLPRVSGPRSSRFSAPRAAARRRSCASSPDSRPRRRGRSSWTARLSTRSRRAAGTSASSSRTTRSTPT